MSTPTRDELIQRILNGWPREPSEDELAWLHQQSVKELQRIAKGFERPDGKRATLKGSIVEETRLPRGMSYLNLSASTKRNPVNLCHDALNDPLAVKEVHPIEKELEPDKQRTLERLPNPTGWNRPWRFWREIHFRPILDIGPGDTQDDAIAYELQRECHYQGAFPIADPKARGRWFQRPYDQLDALLDAKQHMGPDFCSAWSIEDFDPNHWVCPWNKLKDSKKRQWTGWRTQPPSIGIEGEYGHLGSVLISIMVDHIHAKPAGDQFLRPRILRDRLTASLEQASTPGHNLITPFREYISRLDTDVKRQIPHTVNPLETVLVKVDTKLTHKRWLDAVEDLTQGIRFASPPHGARPAEIKALLRGLAVYRIRSHNWEHPGGVKKQTMTFARQRILIEQQGLHNWRPDAINERVSKTLNDDFARVKHLVE